MALPTMLRSLCRARSEPGHVTHGAGDHRFGRRGRAADARGQRRAAQRDRCVSRRRTTSCSPARICRRSDRRGRRSSRTTSTPVRSSGACRTAALPRRQHSASRPTVARIGHAAACWRPAAGCSLPHPDPTRRCAPTIAGRARWSGRSRCPRRPMGCRRRTRSAGDSSSCAGGGGHGWNPARFPTLAGAGRERLHRVRAAEVGPRLRQRHATGRGPLRTPREQQAERAVLG